ncbi:MAG: peptidoglycan-binding protein [Ilumatobacter sp.]|nr:peptidoglycan-binding protein [Ilumatobacter sp.]
MVAAGLIGLLVLGIIGVQQVRGGDAPAAQPTQTVIPQAAVTAPPTTVAAEQIEPAACMLEVPEVSVGDTGTDVECAQRALRAAGVMDADVSGTFDEVTQAATRSFQAEVGLFVDGIIGKNTATELGIWPGAEAFIVRTPEPAPGAVDLIGMPLSSVASAGSDAPPLPDGADLASGKRVIYDRNAQRVWAVDDQERIVRSYLVSGSRFRNEVPGVHTVYSKSEVALGWDLQADLPYMVRYTQTERGHIGFHAIPSWNDTGEALQTEAELGQKLSGGCTRQALLDAQFMYTFADVGTTVIVL